MALNFPNDVRFDQTGGIVGEIAQAGPRRAVPGILRSTSAANNVVGRAFRHVAGDDNAVGADVTGAFAGILINPKNYALRGTQAGGTLAPSSTLPNELPVELLTFGQIFVTLTTTANIGWNVFYADADGQLAAAAGTTLVDHTLIPDSRVIRNNITTAGLLAIVEIGG